jgi:outer membrane protein assembly factor BamB
MIKIQKIHPLLLLSSPTSRRMISTMLRLDNKETLMRTFRIFMVALILGTFFGMSAIPPLHANADDSTNVPMFRGNAARTGEMPGPGPIGLPFKRWNFYTGYANSNSPVVSNGVAYIGSVNDYIFYAIDVATGHPLWTFRDENREFSSAAIVDGAVYVGAGYQLYAIDAVTGMQRWRFSTHHDIRSSPAVVDGIVYVGSNDGNLYAVDATTGSQRWSLTLNDGGNVGSSPAIVDGTVYVGSGSGYLFAVDAASGKQRWRFATSDMIFSSPAVENGIVYFGSQDGNLYAVDTVSGKLKWSFGTDGSIDSSPAVAEGFVYVGSNDGNLYAIDATSGSMRWKFAADGGVNSSPAVADGIVYFGSDDGSGNGNFYAVDTSSGQQHWTYQTGSSVRSSPAVLDGVVYFESGNSNLYAIGDPDKNNPQQLREALASNLTYVSLNDTDLPLGLESPQQFGLPDTLATLLPSGSEVTSTIAYAIQSSSDATATVTFSVYASSDDASKAFNDAPQVLARGGWQQRDPEGIDHDATCLTLQSADKSEAICYVSRDDVVITAYSMLPVQAVDAVFANANDLARYGSNVYDRTNRDG